jgi:F420-non-reducing hydrogenase small subunit
MANKPKAAVCWLGACGGCDEAIVDLNEALLQIAEAVDIVLWPIAMDFKYKDIEARKDGEIALSLLAGSVRNSEHVEIAELLRRKSQLIIGFGACACLGGTAALANFTTKEDILGWVYRDAPTVVNPLGSMPQTETRVNGKTLFLPEFFDRVYSLAQVIDVDYYLPGCPPPPDLITNAIHAVLTGDLPPRGATIAPRKALCDMCDRNKRKPYRIEIEKIKRIHEIEADRDLCFLEQGIICLGPATRAGCGETCIRTNVPCRGCFGPVPQVTDAGARYLSALAALLKADTDDEARGVIDSIDDPAGYFYRFCQPTSILAWKRAPKYAEDKHV